MKKLEKEYQKDILNYLKTKGIKAYKIQGSYTIEPGVPDILAVKEGQFYFFEVKTPKAKATELQQLQMNALLSHGAIGGVVTTTEDVENIIKGDK